MDPSRLQVRICSMNMAGNPAPQRTELVQWLGSCKAVPDIVVVGVQDAMKTGAQRLELELTAVELRLESVGPGKVVYIRLSKKNVSEDIDMQALVKPKHVTPPHDYCDHVSHDNRVVVQVHEEQQKIFTDQVLLVEVVVESVARSGKHRWAGICDHWALVSFASLSDEEISRGNTLQPQPLWAQKGEPKRDGATKMHMPDDSNVLVSWTPVTLPIKSPLTAAVELPQFLRPLLPLEASLVAAE
eukprot:COSAG02_NODE_2453_length_8820_cov_6.109964_2_plen_243_part_00